MSFKIIRNNIINVSADAIVNTANPEPNYASGVDSAIYKAAGTKKLPEDNKTIFSSEYKLHMPTEQELISAVEKEKF